MLTPNEAVKELRLLRCKRSYDNNELLTYHTCLNIIEEALCEGSCVIADLTTFDDTDPEQCYNIIQKSKQTP